MAVHRMSGRWFWTAYTEEALLEEGPDEGHDSADAAMRVAEAWVAGQKGQGR